MAEDKDLSEQFNILFDDITENHDDLKEEATEAAQDMFEEVTEDFQSVEEDLYEQAETVEEKVLSTEESVSEALDNVSVDSLFDDITDSEDEEDRKAGERYLKDEADEDEILPGDEEDEEEPKPVKKKKVKAPDDEPTRKEDVRFWVFTAVIALLVVAAVLFILYKRGIIFNNDTPETTQVETLPSVQTTESEEQTTDEDVTTEPDTTEEETTEEITSETADDVLSHYQNLFVVKVTDSLTLRDKPSTDGQKIGTFKNLAGGNILAEENGWYKVSSGGLTGYVYAQYAVKGTEAEALAKENAFKACQVNTESGLNIRANASTDSNVVSLAPNGAILRYTGEEGDFYKISYNGYTGFVSKDYVVLGYFLEGATKVPN